MSNVVGARRVNRGSISVADQSGQDDKRSKQESDRKSVRHETVVDKFKHASLKLIDKIDSVRSKNIDLVELKPHRQKSIALSSQFSDGY